MTLDHESAADPFDDGEPPWWEPVAWVILATLGCALAAGVVILFVMG